VRAPPPIVNSVRASSFAFVVEDLPQRPFPPSPFFPIVLRNKIGSFPPPNNRRTPPFPLGKNLPPPPPFFSDLRRAVLGKRVFPFLLAGKRVFPFGSCKDSISFLLELRLIFFFQTYSPPFFLPSEVLINTSFSSLSCLLAALSPDKPAFCFENLFFLPFDAPLNLRFCFFLLRDMSVFSPPPSTARETFSGSTTG